MPESAYRFLIRGNSRPGLKTTAIILGLALLADSSPCAARAYRCTDSQGNITYSQSPCSGDQTGSSILGRASTISGDREACTLLRDFAAKSFDKLKRGAEPSALIDEYGGPGYIDRLTLNVINFTSGFRFTKQLPVSKVSVLAYNKCKSGGFGRIRAGDLPPEMLPPETQTSEPPKQFPSQYTPVAEAPAQYEAQNDRRDSLCQDYQQRLHELNRNMRRGYDAGAGQRIRKERRQYEALLRENCQH